MKIGIIALGSHQERHGAALPIDTDAKIAEHIARKTADRTVAEYLGTLKSSYELPEIKTGEHQSMEKLIEELKDEASKARSDGFEGIVLVNAHGGNQELENHLESVGEESQMGLKMDSSICRIEGPHSGTGELSVGSIIGITDKSKIAEHSDIEKYPEVGFAGLEEVRKKYEWAEEHAQEIIEKGVEVDEFLGRILLKSAIASAANRVQEMELENQ